MVSEVLVSQYKLEIPLRECGSKEYVGVGMCFCCLIVW